MLFLDKKLKLLKNNNNNTSTSLLIVEPCRETSGPEGRHYLDAPLQAVHVREFRLGE